MARGRSRSSRVRGFRPATDWAGATVIGALTAGVGGSDVDQWDLSTIFAGTGAPEISIGDFPETLRRTRGRWHAYPVTWPGGPAPGEVEVAVGICVASDPATLQSPILDSGWDGWLYRDWSFWRLPGGITTPTTPVTNMPYQLQGQGDGGVGHIDSRAMRKIDDNRLVMVVEMGTDTGAAVVMNYIVDLRCLFSPTSKA